MEFVSVSEPKFPNRVINHASQVTAKEAHEYCSHNDLRVIGVWGYFEGPMFIGSYVYSDPDGKIYKLAVTHEYSNNRVVSSEYSFIETKLHVNGLSERIGCFDGLRIIDHNTP